MTCRHCKKEKATIRDCSKKYKNIVYYYYSCRECNTERAKKYRETPNGREAINNAVHK